MEVRSYRQDRGVRGGGPVSEIELGDGLAIRSLQQIVAETLHISKSLEWMAALMHHPGFAQIQQFAANDWMIVMQIEGKGTVTYRDDTCFSVLRAWAADHA